MIGIRPGEKLHEVLVTEDESRHARALPDRYIIYPAVRVLAVASRPDRRGAATGFRYSSDTNSQWLTTDDIRAMANVVSAADQ